MSGPGLALGPGRVATRRLLLVAALYYSGAVVLTTFLLLDSNAATRTYRELVTYHSAEEKTDTLVKEVLEGLSLGLYQGASEKAQKLRTLNQIAHSNEARARTAAWTLAAGSLLFLGFAASATSKVEPPATDTVILHVLGVSGICLVVGLVAPILTISAHAEVAVLGRVVLQHETKGILGTIAKLVGSGNLVIAVLLALFSVVTPLIKLLLSAAALLVRSRAARRVSLGTVELIGKWSMTDVFVVAVLLAFLAARTEQLTDATLGIGLYFFAAYGVLSLAASQLMVRLHRPNPPIP